MSTNCPQTGGASLVFQCCSEVNEMLPIVKCSDDDSSSRDDISTTCMVATCMVAVQM